MKAKQVIIFFFVIALAFFPLGVFADECTTFCEQSAQDQCNRAFPNDRTSADYNACISAEAETCIQDTCSNSTPQDPNNDPSTGSQTDDSVPVGPGQPGFVGPTLPPGYDPNTTTNVELENPIGAKDLTELASAVANTLIKLAIPIAVIIIIWAGIQFFLANGNSEKVSKAKQTLLWTMVGLAVILIGSGFIDLIKDILSLSKGR